MYALKGRLLGTGNQLVDVHAVVRGGVVIMESQRRALAAAVLIAVSIHQDAIQPGAKFCGTCKLVCVTRYQRFDASVMHQIFGVTSRFWMVFSKIENIT